MKILLFFLLLIGCGTFEGPSGSNGLKGSSCAVDNKQDKAIIKCDDGSSYIVENGKDGEDGEKGKNGEDGKDFAPTPKISFEGYYLLPYGGYIELIETSEGAIYIYGTQRVYSRNFDRELALHPNLPSGPHYIKNGIIRGEYSSNYRSDTNDLEQDGTTHNITGRRKTVYTLSLKNQRLKINLKIYDDNGLEIKCNRNITSRND